MSSLKRFAASASAVALAGGVTLAGAGFASAQDNGDESTGSLGSAGLDLGDIAGDLGTAAEALNGPVVVTPNEEGGPTVTYVNETDANQNCLGFTAPYSTVIEDDLDTDYDPDDLLAALELINALEDGGDVALFGGDEDGAPEAFLDPDPDEGGDVVDHVVGLALGGEGMADAPAVQVEPGEDVAWNAPAPGSPALTVVLCQPDAGDDLRTYTGIDPQVVADQINDRLGPLGSIGAGSISGGSVDMGAMALGSLAGGGDDGDDGDNGGDDDNDNGDDDNGNGDPAPGDPAPGE